MPGRVARKHLIYVETSIFDMLTARPTRDIVITYRQKLARRWWEEEKPKYRLVISPTVVEEAQHGAAEAVEQRLSALAGIKVLKRCDEVEELARRFRAELGIPEKAAAAALHLAYATHYNVDFLLTWNNAHLANGEIMLRLSRLAREQNLRQPIICTPNHMVNVHDPIVEEVHRIREKLAAECGYDMHKMMERDREFLKKWKGKVVTKKDLQRERSQARKS